MFVERSALGSLMRAAVIPIEEQLSIGSLLLFGAGEHQAMRVSCVRSLSLVPGCASFEGTEADLHLHGGVYENWLNGCSSASRGGMIDVRTTTSWMFASIFLNTLERIYGVLRFYNSRSFQSRVGGSIAVGGAWTAQCQQTENQPAEHEPSHLDQPFCTNPHARISFPEKQETCTFAHFRTCVRREIVQLPTRLMASSHTICRCTAQVVYLPKHWHAQTSPGRTSLRRSLFALPTAHCTRCWWTKSKQRTLPTRCSHLSSMPCG